MTTKTLDLQAIKALFNNAPIEVVNLDDLELHAGTQQRSKPNKEAMETYSEAMAEGEADNFPPLRVVRLTEAVTLEDDCELEKGALILADGFTRHGAAEANDLETFRAEVVNGTLQDAVQFSYVANSLHGSKLDQKDYQALIRKIHLQDPSIKKGDIARAVGCSAQTVSKAMGIVEAEYKQKARTMMDSGFSDKEIAQEVHKAEQTIKNWRDAYTEEKAQPEPEPKAINPMKMRFEDVLGLDDLEKQQSLLDMLQTRVFENMKKVGIEPGLPVEPTAAPEAPEEQLQLTEGNDTPEAPEAPQEATEAPETATDDAPFDVDEEQGEETPRTCWEILGRDKEQVSGLANPKASLNRTVRTVAHTEGEEVAKAALAEALAELAAE